MRYLIFISAILIFFSSCSNDSKSDLAVFKATTNGLERSSVTISKISADFHRQLVEKLNDPKSAAQVAIWQPRALRISELASSMIEYINKVKSQLIEESGYQISDKAAAFESDNTKAVRKIFFQQNKGKELYQRLRNFIDSIKNIEPGLSRVFSEELEDNYDYLDSSKYDHRGFSQTFFNQVSTATALSVLAKFENDIRNTEKEIISFCYSRTVPGCGLGYEAFKIILAQSSDNVKAGDYIEITAGVGAFSVAAQPKFTIDGKLTPSDEDGILIYKFKTPSKAGKYTKSVKMEYLKPDGTKESITKEIEYNVIESN